MATVSFGQQSIKKKSNKLSTKTNHKLRIYQVMIHLWGNTTQTNKINGTLEENGVGKFDDFNEKALKSISDFGYSHIYFTGVIRHATTLDYSKIGVPTQNALNIKGLAGAPFAVTDYYDVNPFLATNPENRISEFENMVARCHKAGLKVIIDCVPNHVAREYESIAKPKGVKDFGENDDNKKAFDPQNNFYYLPNQHYTSPITKNGNASVEIYHEYPAKVTGNDVFNANPSVDDWFETVKLNYGVDYQDHRKKHFDPLPSTWLKMEEMLKYWSKKGVDGFRCDMAEMVPVEFWGYVIPKIKKTNPSIVFIAEIYNPNEYHNYIKNGKFDYLYDKVGLYDALRRLMENKPEANANHITKVWQNESGDISENMLRFLENHDEQRITSDFFAKDPWTAIPAMTVAATLHNGPLMLYFGQEFGEKAMDEEGFGKKDGRTTMFDFWTVTEHAKWINGGKFDGAGLSENQKRLAQFYSSLIKFTKDNEAINNGQFYDLQYANTNAQGYDNRLVYSYLRYTNKQKLLIVCNFSQDKSYNIKLSIPDHALELMKINKGKTLKIIDKTNGKNIANFNARESLNIELPALGVVIYELK